MNGSSIGIRTIAHRPLLRRLLRPVAVFALIVLAGAAGFSTLSGIHIVEALFWLLDPTSIELHFQNHDGPAMVVKAYAIVILSGLVVAGLWIGETLLSAAFGGQIQDEFKQMHIEQTISELEEHVIVCGYGTFGQTIAARLCEKDRPVVVVEQQASQYQQALDNGLLAVRGDARDEEALSDASVKRALTVVGAIDDANANIQIAITASQLAPTVILVVRAGDRRDEILARRAGADEVVIPEVVSGEQICTNL